MYEPQEANRTLLGHHVRIHITPEETETAIIVRTTINGLIKVRTNDGTFLWGNQWEEI